MPTSSDQPQASENLLRLIEAAPQVRRRSQFFMWTQGDLQRWLPHRLLVCGVYDREHQGLVFDVFNSLTLPARVLRDLHHGRAGLNLWALHAWRQQQLQACWLRLSDIPQPDDALHELMDAGYRHVLVHGVCRPGRADEVESFFMFGSPEQGEADSALLSIDMLLPCLHATYQRVHSMERQMGGGSAAPPLNGGAATPKLAAITERERQILSCVRDGLSNQQIGEKLSISALTVKNHVQRILRKLHCANRAQAVAKAMTFNLLSTAPPGQVSGSNEQR